MSLAKTTEKTTASTGSTITIDATATTNLSKEGKDDEELAFVYLEECDIDVPFSEEQDGDVCHVPCSKWLPVAVPAHLTSPLQKEPFVGLESRPCTDSDTNQQEEKDEQTNNKYHEDPCSKCNLLLRRQKLRQDLKGNNNKESGNNPLLCLLDDVGPRFDGTLDDSKPNDCPCCTHHTRRQRQRSDAALLVGLLLTCQDMKHASICSIQVRFKPNEKQQAVVVGSYQRRAKASLVMTFSIPEAVIEQKNNNTPLTSPRRRGHPSYITEDDGSDKVKGGKRRRFMTSSSKPLPHSTQLLLSILRSDWGVLERVIQYPETGQPQAASRHARISAWRSFFPPRVSLDEVYERIGGAASTLNDELVAEDKGHNHKEEQESKHNLLLCLPKDVIKYRVAVYLRSKSLDSFRCTCKTLYQDLQAVVPGLKLRLYSHQVKSLTWMRHRETTAISESDLAIHDHRNHRTSNRRHRCIHEKDDGGDTHRAASGGASVLFCQRSNPNHEFRISQHNGDEIIILPDDPLARNVARGGLLCDDPGLGKTITVISLILQTLGLSTEGQESAVSDDEASSCSSQCNDNRIFLEYWKEQVVPTFRTMALNKLLSDFCRSSVDVGYFVRPVDPKLDECPDYFDVIKNPICFKDIRRKIDSYSYGDSFSDFQTDVELCFENAMEYNPDDNDVHIAAKELMSVFSNMVKEFKNKQISAAKKSFSCSASKPNSAVAALVERDNKLRLKESLVGSPGTLLVVPSNLLEHWEEQLRLHVDSTYCTGKPPVVFEYTGIGDSGLKMEEILSDCKIKNTHFPLVFVDKTGTKKLPSPHFLAMFSIVITTNQRFANEWKNGSFESEQKREGQDNGGEFDYRTCVSSSDEACPLLKVNWLRMIVDEGHSMGRSKDNSAISFASWISAERRWAMTGTPTRQTVSQTGLTSILHLMQYLQHDFFSRRQDGQLSWQNLISKGWPRGHLSAFFRLRSLLSLLMVRHTKLDIEELPPPCYHQTILPMSAEEIKTYNSLVCAVQSNLLITSMEGKTSGLQDSLLHKRQSKHAKDALRNIRLVCAGGTQVIPTITDAFYDEFLHDFQECNADPEKLEDMKTYLARATTEQLSMCQCCGIMLTTLLVFPCGDLVCTECADHRSNSCVVCDKIFDVDLFQRLQPGMDYQWLHNIEAPKEKTISVAAAPAPTGLLEGGAGLLSPVDETRPRIRTRKPGDGHECVYNPKRADGACDLCWKEHDECNLLATGACCPVCYRQAEECPGFETKNSYLVEKLLTLYEDYRKRNGSVTIDSSTAESMENGTGPQPRKLKVIVFSQFRSVLNTTGHRLLKRFGTGCVAEYWGKFRKQELRKFIYDPDCLCMLLGKDGSEGLDLSFVTHIFFLEQVWDKSLEQQAVARAWRMGAKGVVQVETLVAANGVEETMARLEKRLEERNTEVTDQEMLAATEAGKTSEYQRAKLYFLLKSLRLIANSHTSSFGVSDGTKRKSPLKSIESLDTGRVKKKARVRFQV